LKNLFEILIEKYSKILQIEIHTQCNFYKGRRKNTEFSKSFKQAKPTIKANRPACMGCSFFKI